MSVVVVVDVVITTARIPAQRRDETRRKKGREMERGSCSLHAEAEAAEQQQNMRRGLTLMMMASRSRNGIPPSQ